jgi:hypothetical protein
MGLCKSNNINTQFIFNQEVIHEKFWNKKTKIYEIIQDFKVDYDKGDLFYFEINNEEIDLKKKIIDYRLIDKKLIIYIKSLFKLPNNIEEYIINNSMLFGAVNIPTSNFYIYNKETKDFQKKAFREFKIEDLNYVTHYSSYCNGINTLYIFGGEKDNKSIFLFLILDLKTMKFKKYEANFHPNHLHSMIFIPKYYVFIFGDLNTFDNCIYFDTEKNVFFPYKKIEEEIESPSLSCINNQYLYVFKEKGLKLLIYKTDLKKKPNWEKIEPKYKKDVNVYMTIFAVSKLNANSIIFFGRNDCRNEINNEIDSFEYNWEENTLNEGKVSYKEKLNFIEKSFIPLNKNLYSNIPSDTIFKIVNFDLSSIQITIDVENTEKKSNVENKEKKLNVENIEKKLNVENIEKKSNIENKSKINEITTETRDSFKILDLNQIDNKLKTTVRFDSQVINNDSNKDNIMGLNFNYEKNNDNGNFEGDNNLNNDDDDIVDQKSIHQNINNANEEDPNDNQNSIFNTVPIDKKCGCFKC